MKSTLEKICEASSKDEVLAGELCKYLKNEFSRIGSLALISFMKNSIKYANIPNWVKECFINEKSYTLQVGSDGNIEKIKIEKIFINPDNSNEEYHIHAEISPTNMIIIGGEIYTKMSQIISVDDMEDLLNIKIF